jgi:Leucine rich repeat N-terminal domain
MNFLLIARKSLFFFVEIKNIELNTAVILRALMDQWENKPPSWEQSDDPCGTPWEGISCSTNSRVTVM